MDLDQGNRGDDHEYMGFVGAFEGYYLSPGTEVRVQQESHGGTTFYSTLAGTGKDNPDDAMTLTEAQKVRSVTGEFRDRSWVELTMGIEKNTPGKGGCPADSGRNLMFGFKSIL